jgi:uncharacterized NAD(P)/FAD-binding protein YdhS
MRIAIATDPLRLGLRVSDDGALVGAGGKASRVMYYVGPLLKARDWEATAVPELRVHAARLAGRLCDRDLDRRSLSADKGAA